MTPTTLHYELLVLGEIPELETLLDESPFRDSRVVEATFVERPEQFGTVIGNSEADILLTEASELGLEVLEEAVERRPLRPVVMVGDRADAAHIVEAKKRGLQRYVLRVGDEKLDRELLVEELDSIFDQCAQPPSVDRQGIQPVVRHAQYHNASQPFFVVGPDRRLLYVNRAGEEFVDRVHEHRPRFGAPLDDLLDETSPEAFAGYIGRAIDGEGIEIERSYEGLPADQRHYRLAFQPVAPDDERIVAVSVSLENIGRRVEAESKFDRVEEVLLHHFECSPLPMKVIDEHGVIEKCNPAFRDLLGYETVEAIEGKPVRETVHEDDLEGCLHPLRDVLEERAPYARVELREIGADGSLTWTDHVGLLLPESVTRDEQKRRVLVIAVDITRQKQAEQRARRSVRMQALGELAGGVAHDFNNVLSIVSTVGHLLKTKLADRDDEELLDYVERIEEAVESGTSLTRQLMSFGRDGETDGVAADLNEAIREVNSLLARALGERIEIDVELAEELPPVGSDSGRLRQVVTNLAVNARDAIEGKGRLSIETELRSFERDDPAAPTRKMADSDYVVLRVSDTGVGMDEETLERIFDPFFTTKDSSQGTGLGLATVYKIVDDAGGHIEVDSEPGEGTIFEVYFPPVARKRASNREGVEEGVREEEIDREARRAGGSSERGEKRLLLLEDEADLRAPYRIHLEREGYQVLEAGSLDEAQRRVEEGGEVDVLVADVVLPDGSGVDFARRLRDRSQALPVVFISGYAPDLFSNQREEFDGDWEFLAKPVDSDELLSAVNGLSRPRGSAHG